MSPPDHPEPRPQSTAGFLARWARQRPAAIAIDAIDGQTSYFALAQMALRIRDVLIGAGIAGGQVLGVIIPDRKAHLAALLAAETLGVTTISLTAAEIGTPMNLDGLCDQLLISDPIPAVRSAKIARLPPEALDGSGPARPLDALEHGPDPSFVVRLIKSSGTTGLPKVMTMTHLVQQRTLSNNLRYAKPVIAPHPHYLCLYNFSVRGSHSRALLTLQMGGTIYLAGTDVIGDLIAAGLGNYVLFVAGDLERFARSPRPHRLRPDLHIDVIGSAVSARLRQMIQSQVTPHIAVTYGANEVHHVSLVDEANVGTLFPGVRIRILDEAGRPVTPGERGLIQIRSGTMTSGYLNAPELTAATFVKGWYRSRDIGYQPTPETLVVLGRADDVVVVGGRKMAPEPIEDALRGIPGVRDAAVMGVDNLLDTGVMLVAVEVDADGTTSDLATRIAQIVTPHAADFQLLPLAALPRTETGKIRREAVKALYRDSISRM